MAQQVLCLVTIHGIGFEQAPDNGTPGYADGLHKRLSQALGANLLSDDPGRAPGQNGAIYVQSLWPPQEPTREQGLSRLGKWLSRPDRTVDIAQAPLVTGDQRIAHVALVYSHLEAQGPHPGAGTVAAAMAAVSVGHYASVLGFARMAFGDLEALVASHQSARNEASPSLQVRSDTPPHHHWWDLSFRHRDATNPADPAGLLATIHNLEDDVAAYVSRNDLRERVRGFVREALYRLACRDDVAGIAINSHSNGTVVAFDVLRDLPFFLAQKVQWFVTAGSPLRKYTDLFNWGTEAGSLRALQGWTNFWDSKDPVADPLQPPAAWRRGDVIPPADAQTSLYQAVDPDTSESKPIPITDVEVDNIGHGGSGGLPAHDYWDNTEEVIQPLAEILRRLVG